MNTQTYKYINQQTCIYVYVCGFMYLWFYAFVFSLPFFAICCLVKRKAKHPRQVWKPDAGCLLLMTSDRIAGDGDEKGWRLFLPFYPFTFLPFLKLHQALLFSPRIIQRERKGRMAVIEGTAYHRYVVALQSDAW